MVARLLFKLMHNFLDNEVKIFLDFLGPLTQVVIADRKSQLHNVSCVNVYRFAERMRALVA